nr:hypothetical protein Iba_chr14fCG11000 [Ipomoea batatas]
MRRRQSSSSPPAVTSVPAMAAIAAMKKFDMQVQSAGLLGVGFYCRWLIWKVWDSKRQSQSFDDPSSLQNQNHRRENGSRLIIPLPLASFQPPSHHHQLRQPPTTTPPEKNQSHEEESKVVGHCRCCFAGGSFIASRLTSELAVSAGRGREKDMEPTN